MNEAEFTKEVATPRWAKDLLRFLPVKAQFILSGNIRDYYPFPRGESSATEATATARAQYLPMPLPNYVTEVVRLAGYEVFLAYHPVDGLYVIVPRGEEAEAVRKRANDLFKLGLDAGGYFKCSLQKALEVVEKVVTCREAACAVLLDFASRYIKRVDSLDDKEHEFFTRALALCHKAQPVMTSKMAAALFNPVIWMCDKENDLPDWLVLNNPRLRAITLPKPDHIIRGALVSQLTSGLPGFKEASEQKRKQLHEVFNEQTEGLYLTDVIAVAQLCRREKLGFEEIGEAVRRYKLGVTEDPWKRLDREKIAGAEETIRKRVKGQHRAVVKSLDIIKRAVTGLSGAQGSKVGGRPRGVMFLAGPTGTGKTELAKTLTELLFGDERAYIRFDMSEFSQEHADQRLIGSPPGYIGSDMGGELTNAIREKPFSVVLFDEIEKAHPRILDKFLQILDDGVLTSGRGERVYFSESVIIFTSNLGIYKLDDEGRRVLNVKDDEPYETVERRVRDEISNYFKTQINRPEILNRIGENIVVFDFIRPDVAIQIFDKMLANILERLADRQKVRIQIPDTVRDQLRGHCLKDLSNGGRGVGNQLEAWFINPLARALFEVNPPEGATRNLASLTEKKGVPTITLE